MIVMDILSKIVIVSEVRFELPELEAFSAFAEHLNFTHAARVLHLSQPALFARVQRLQETAGGPLYHRVGRGLELTELGQRVARFAREVLEHCAQFESELTDATQPRPVRLAAGEGAYLYLLAPALRRLIARGVPLELQVADATETLGRLGSGYVQLGVAPMDQPPAELESERLACVPLALAMPTHHALARGEVPLAALFDVPLVVPPKGRPLRTLLEQRFAQHARTLHPAIEVHGWPLMLQFVAMGAGLAVVNAFCRPPRGVVLKPLPELPPQTYWLLQRPGLVSPSVTRVRSELVRAFHDPGQVG